MMMFRDVRVICVLLSCVIGSSATWESRTNCLNSCGNITVHYPFGISVGCAYDGRFMMRCNEIEKKAFLANSNVQVLNLSLDGEIQVLLPISRHCHNTTGDGVEISKISTDFTFSNKNRMTIVGCNVDGGVLNEDRVSLSGCITNCSSTQTTDRPCYGSDGCCQSLIHSGVNTLRLLSSPSDDVWDRCNYVFIVKDGYFNFSAQEDLKNLRNVTSFPVILEWTVGNQTCPPVGDADASSCGKNSICINSTTASGYSCKCQHGFQGNPYLGCRGIDKKSKDWKIIILGSIIGFLIFLLGVCGLKLKLQNQKQAKLREKRFEDNGGLMLVQRLLELGAQSSRPCIEILSDKEIKIATNNFHESRILGVGAQGVVYHGTLSDKTEVAIKKAKVGDRDQVAQFINELVVLSQMDHPHVVNLVSCCLETEVPLLVYEYVSGGTLYDNLLGSSLPWDDRLRIAAEIAETLAYLHSVSPTPIVHRDVKPSNVLLDDNLSVKLCDFGVSRLVPADREELTTLVKGTLGYLDPEYMHTGTLSQKSDVYSYGVVLMELVTGEKALCFERPQSRQNLVAHLEFALREDRLDQVIDTRVVKAENRREIYEVVSLATTCTRLKGEQRPEMREIATALQVLRDEQKHGSGRFLSGFEIQASS